MKIVVAVVVLVVLDENVSSKIAYVMSMHSLDYEARWFPVSLIARLCELCYEIY